MTTVVTVIAGFIVVPTLANVAPTAVNGFLLLLLLGIILLNSDKWIPYLPGYVAPSGSSTNPSQTNPPGTLVGAGG